MTLSFKNLFVPLDFSSGSIEAARFAARLGEAQQARITLFHANVLHTEDRNAELEDVARDLSARHPALEIKARCERSIDAADGILEAARDEGTDLIVLGSRARGRTAELLFGGITRKVIRHSDASVFVVHDAPPSLEQHTLSLTLALDLTDGSQALIEDADRLARSLEARLDVVHVIEPEHPAATGALPELQTNPHRPRTAQALTRLSALLDEAVDSRRPEACTVSARCLQGDPTKALREHLKASEPDILLLGTHGRTGVQRALLGSVSEQLTTETPLPVLVLKPRVAQATTT